ncbi:MAG: hypothetical protein HDKAJFGB_03937 [Anaerolineae bacterium]|nr:hypothetical protein [Anaerolineae bacterium]
MGILTEILSSLAIGVVKVAIAGGGALARIGARAVAEARPRIAAAVQAFRQGYHLERSKRAVRTGSRGDIHAELEAINDLLAELGSKARSAGLSVKERSRKEELAHQRDQLLSALQSVDEQRIAEKIVDRQSEFDALTISNDTSHLLQSTVGQTLYGKPCPKCGWQMQLQWDRNKNTIGTNDFGWGCTGWYWSGKEGVPHKCTYWEPLAPEDYDVFAQAKRPEYSELSARQFSDLVLGHDNIVVKRMDDVRRDSSLRGSVDAYRCPVHGEPLVLQQKREHTGRLLDMYFLGCPRWKGRNEGCQYMVKLKSPAQLHAYLEVATGEGVI